MARHGRKRLTVDLLAPIYDQLSLMAKRRNITKTRMLTRILLYAMQRERYLEENGQDRSNISGNNQ